MANKLIYSATNPVQMYSLTSVTDVRYVGKDFEDFEFPDTIMPWEQHVRFQQPWMKADSIALQLQTNVGPVELKLRRCDGALVNTVLMTQGAQSTTEPGLYIYEILLSLATYPEGVYYIELAFGNSGSGAVFLLRSGDLSIKTAQPGTLLMEFQHYEFREDLIFETGFFPSVRFVGRKKYIGPKQQSTVYNDQVYNLTALRSIKYRLWELVVGGSKGIPDYFIDMLGGAIGCSKLLIDGKAYTVAENAEFEANGINNYPMRAWRIQLREKYNRASRQYENDTPINATLTAIINVDSKGFGNSTGGSQTAVINVE